jgi:hypothetical protein
MMIVSEKFNDYYEKLTTEDKIEAMKIVNTLCEEHERIMNIKHEKLLVIGTAANDLLFKALTGGNTDEISKKMRELKEEAEKLSKYMPIERYIEINFGL